MMADLMGLNRLGSPVVYLKKSCTRAVFMIAVPHAPQHHFKRRTIASVIHIDGAS